MLTETELQFQNQNLIRPVKRSHGVNLSDCHVTNSVNNENENDSLEGERRESFSEMEVEGVVERRRALEKSI